MAVHPPSTAFSVLCGQSLVPFPKCFQHPSSTSVRVMCPLPLLTPSPWRPPPSFPSLDWTALGPSEKGVVHHPSFCGPPLAPNTMFSSSHVVTYARPSFLFKAEGCWTPPWRSTPLRKDSWPLPPSGYRAEHSYGQTCASFHPHTRSQVWGSRARGGLLGHMVVLFSFRLACFQLLFWCGLIG